MKPYDSTTAQIARTTLSAEDAFYEAVRTTLYEAVRATRCRLILRPRSEWHEDDGHVLWYHLPLQEPPYVGLDDEAFNARNADGTPTTCHRLLASGWLTHWTPLPTPIYAPTPQDGEKFNG